MSISYPPDYEDTDQIDGLMPESAGNATIPHVDEKKFPLTKQWLQLIVRYSFVYHRSVIDFLQEAYILEWDMKKRVYESLAHKQNSFKRSLYALLYRKRNDWEGILEYSSVDKDGKKSEYGFTSGKSYIVTETEDEMAERRENGRLLKTKPSKDAPIRRKKTYQSDTISLDVDLVDSLIQMRPFDEVYYQDLVAHTAILLAQKSSLARQMFLDRVNLKLQWNELRNEAHYKEVAHYSFYNAVKFIKRVVRKEMYCFA